MSSSSSSSLDITSSSSNPWNFVKPLVFGHSATDNGTIKNRIAQTILIKETSLSIKKVYCYLYGPYHNKDLTPFNMYLGVYDCSNDGTPNTLVSEISIPSSDITGDGWYEFLLNTPTFSISNEYVSFVMRQSGGDENNYALWGYVNIIDDSSSLAFISNDDSTWQNIEDTCFGMKVISGNSTLFDLDNGTVITQGADVEETNVSLIDLQNSTNTTTVEYDGTHIIDNPYDPGSPVVAIEEKRLFISFVMDKSGSMGWIDRFKKRVDFTNTLISELSNNYSAEVLYDIIGFGAVQLDTTSLTQEGTVARINLDARIPTRTTYIFTSKDISNVYTDDVYSNNNYEYIVANNSVGGIYVQCIGSEDPFSSGTLVKSSGLGDSLIEFDTYSKTSIDNGSFVSCGFKNLYPNKTYNIDTIQIDNVDIVGPESNYWKMFVPSWETYPISEYPSMTLGPNGAYDNDSVDISIPTISNTKTDVTIINSLYSANDTIASSNVISYISIGDTDITVSNASPFAIGDAIDILDGKNFSYNHTITEISGQTITIDPPARYNIYDSNAFGGIIQKSIFFTPPVKFGGTTFMILLRDQTASNSSPYQTVTFFLQTTSGYKIEWDFMPYKEWKKPLFYWIGDTASFDFNLVDTNGKSLPDGTEIDLLVNGNRAIKSSSNASSNETSVSPDSIAITDTVSVGSNTIYINGMNGLSKGQNVLIVDNLNVQQVTIETVGMDINGNYYITTSSPLQYEFSPDRGANVVIRISTGTTDSIIAISEDPNRIASLPLPFVDITPMYAGVQLNPSYLEPYDPPQIEPTNTYSDIIYDEVRTRNGVYNGPTNDGNSVIRILPITEDIIRSDKDKNNNAELISTLSPPNEPPNQIQLNDTDVIAAPEVVKQNQVFIGDDYTIESPIYLYNGDASSKMVSYAQKFTLNKIDGLRLPIADSNLNSNTYSDTSNEIYSKEYTVSPSVILRFKNNFNSFRQQVDPFYVYFAPRYYIYSNGDGQTIAGSSLPEVYEDPRNPGILLIDPPEIFNAPGIYSTSSNTYSMTFTVTDKLTLMKNGVLTVRLYVNPMVNCEDLRPLLVYNGDPTASTVQSMAVINGTSINYAGRNSDLDAWRNNVATNDLNTILSSLLDSLNDSQEIISAPDVGSSSEKILNQANWALLDKVNLPIKNGSAVLTTESLDYPGLLMTDASFSYGNGQFEVVNKNYFFMGNPLFFRFFNTYVFKPDFAGSSYDVGGRVMWMNNAYGTIQDGTVITMRAANVQTVPSVSETIDGRGDGMIVGPLNSWTYNLEPNPPQIPSMIGD